MKADVFIRPINNDLKIAIKECFDKFGGVDQIIKGNVFLKIPLGNIYDTSIRLCLNVMMFCIIGTIKENKCAYPSNYNEYTNYYRDLVDFHIYCSCSLRT